MSLLMPFYAILQECFRSFNERYLDCLTYFIIACYLNRIMDVYGASLEKDIGFHQRTVALLPEKSFRRNSAILKRLLSS
jgi:hypothetical protein